MNTIFITHKENYELVKDLIDVWSIEDNNIIKAYIQECTENTLNDLKEKLHDIYLSIIETTQSSVYRIIRQSLFRSDSESDSESDYEPEPEPQEPQEPQPETHIMIKASENQWKEIKSAKTGARCPVCLEDLEAMKEVAELSCTFQADIGGKHFMCT